MSSKTKPPPSWVTKELKRKEQRQLGRKGDVERQRMEQRAHKYFSINALDLSLRLGRQKNGKIPQDATAKLFLMSFKGPVNIQHFAAIMDATFIGVTLSELAEQVKRG